MFANYAGMKPTEINLSPELVARIVAMFTPYRRSSWMHTAPQRAGDSAVRANRLEQLLLLEGGEEGRALIEALDGLRSETGAPAILIRGLPADMQDAVAVHHALRAWIGEMPSGYGRHYFSGLDTASDAPEGYDKSGATYLHHDNDSYTLLHCMKAGGNPRHTVLLDGEGLIDYLVDQAKPSDPVQAEQWRQDFAALLQKPVWRYPEQNTRPANAVRQGKNYYAPFLQPNPQYDPWNAGSSRFAYLPIGFDDGRMRIKARDAAWVEPSLRPSFARLQDALRATITKESTTLKDGPVLDTGEMLLFNNRLLLHAGGPFVLDKCRARSADDARHVVALDIPVSGAGTDHPARPGDWQSLIAVEPQGTRSR